MSHREKGVFPNQPKVNPRGGCSSSFDPNVVRKVNAVISLRLGNKVDAHVGEQDMNDSLPYHLLSLSLKAMMCFPPQ